MAQQQGTPRWQIMFLFAILGLLAAFLGAANPQLGVGATLLVLVGVGVIVGAVSVGIADIMRARRR